MRIKIKVLCIVCTFLLLSSCFLPAGSERSEPSSEAPETTAEPTPAAQTPASSLTLEGLKTAARAAGYELAELEEFQIPADPKPLGGFCVHYTDASSDSRIPVFEFQSEADARTYAESVNEAGYNLSILNGRFVTMAGAQYGLTTNDSEAAFLALLLQSEVMAAPEEPSIPVSPPAADYAGACKQIDAIRNALNCFVNRSVLLYDKGTDVNNRFSSAFIFFSMINSGDLSFTATLSENEADRSAVSEVWTMFGVKDMKVTREAAHFYVLTGIRAGMDAPFDIRCEFNPSSGSLRLVEMEGERAIDLIEYVPLGGDVFAFQTKQERALVTYRAGKITAFAYSQLKSDVDWYHPVQHGIYGKEMPDSAWVTSAGEDSFSQLITYDGTKLIISAEGFMGDKMTAEVQIP